LDETLSVTVRNLSRENWEPWKEEGYQDASSIMMVPRTNATSMSCRIIKLNPNGYTELHSHKRIHYVIVLQGIVELKTDKENFMLNDLISVRIEAGVPHKFINKRNETALIQVLNIFKD
jgi:quercetin dioxygenase-like cupin family protein